MSKTTEELMEELVDVLKAEIGEAEVYHIYHHFKISIETAVFILALATMALGVGFLSLKFLIL